MNILRTAIFIVIALCLVGGLHYFVWARLVRDAQLPAPWSAAITYTIVGSVVLTPVLMIAGRLLPPSIGRYFAWPFFVWMGAMFWLFFFSLAGWAGAWAVRGVAGQSLDADRRLFLSRALSGATFGLVSAMTVLAIRRARSPLFVRRVEFTLSRLPKALSGMTIAQLTDIHVGPTIGREFIEEMVEKTNALKPDLICITGDLVDGSVALLRDGVAPLANLRATYGVFFVTGNHEYYSGADEWCAEVERLGIRVLRNEHVSVGPDGASIDLAGIFDWSGGQFSPEHAPSIAKALAGRDVSREVILLAHQPRAVLEAAEHGVGLQLSGHTHGGQIWPWNYFVALQQRWVEGIYREKETQLYVSPGTGYWGPPMRLGTRAEITQLVLKSA